MQSKAVAFLRKNWYWVVIALLILLRLWERSKKALTPDIDPAILRNVPQNSEFGTLRLKADARDIYKELGLDLPFGLSFPWENEGAILAIIKPYDKSNFALLQAQYYALFMRSLTSDLQRWLSPSEFAQIPV